MERFRGNPQAALQAALEVPVYGDELRRAGVRWVTLTHTRRRILFVEPGRRAYCWRLVAAALDNGESDWSVPQPIATRLPSLPRDINLFSFASIQKAVRLFAANESQTAVVAGTVFDKHDAPRLRWLWQRSYLTLDEQRVLQIDWRVGRKGRRYALRVWDERSQRWFDPNKR